MAVMTDQEYADAVFALAEKVRGEFTPFAYPNADGDCVEFYVSSKEFYSQRIDEYLTLFLEEETEEIVGFMIKNITKILNKIASHQAICSFVIQDGEVRLEALFTAMFCNDDRRTLYVREYHKVTDLAKTYDIDKVRILSILEKAGIVPKVSETVSV